MTVYRTALQHRLATLVLAITAEQGMTQEQLAERVGITRSQLNRMLNGRAEGPLHTWQAIFDVLGYDVEVNR